MLYVVLMYRRETIKTNIFRPHIAPPTMTFEEFADLEVKRALERERREKETPPSVTRRLHSSRAAATDVDMLCFVVYRLYIDSWKAMGMKITLT